LCYKRFPNLRQVSVEKKLEFCFTRSSVSGLDALQEHTEFLEDSKIAEFAEERREKLITSFR
jgi:hypothetical protein